MKRAFATVLAAIFVISAFAFSTPAEEPSVRINISRVFCGDDPDVGCYFMFDGEEDELCANTFSRALLAKWDDESGAYVCTGSLGYNSDKTVWDIPSDGFALMISCFADSNAFDLTNTAATESFGYNDGSKDDSLKGKKIYLYNVDLKSGSVKTVGTEGEEGFSSESYLTVGAPAESGETAYDGAGVNITRTPKPNAYNSVKLSHFGAFTGLYGEGSTDDFYDECFFVMPGDFDDASELSDELERYTWAFAAVLEKADDNKAVYRVIHTAKWCDKSEWAGHYFFDADGNRIGGRILLVCQVMNKEASDGVPTPELPGSLTYGFGKENSRAAFYGFDPEEGGESLSEGRFTDCFATFFNVDFKERKVETTGEWGKPDFSSSSYALFTKKIPTDEMISEASVDDGIQPAVNDGEEDDTPENGDPTTAKTTRNNNAPGSPEDESGATNIIIAGGLLLIAVIIVTVLVVKKKKSKK